MNFILHQFKTDVSHFRRGLVVLWISFAAEAAMANFHALTAVGIGISNVAFKGWEAFYGFILIAALVQSDALVGSTAGWLTRPMRRWHLFWAKTAFIVICLFLPWLVIQWIGWALRGYSLHLDMVATAESLLFVGALVLVVAVLAALTRDLARFFLGVGIMATGIFAAYLLVEMLVHAGVLTQALETVETPELSSSARMVAWLVIAAGALVAWISQARLDQWRVAVVWLAAGFLALPVITTVWPVNFLALRLTPSVPLTFSLVATNQPLVNTPQNQLLSTELALSGVPAHQVAVLQQMTAKFRFQGDSTNTVVKAYPAGFYRGRFRPAESLQRNNYFDAISEFFPPETIWFKENYYWSLGSEFDNPDIMNRFPKGLPVARLEGDLTVDLYGVQKVAEAPLRPAEFEALPGLWLDIEKVSLAGDQISMELSERNVHLMFDRSVDTASAGDFGPVKPSCTYILYHPGSGEAFLMSEDNNSYNLFPAVWGGDAFRTINLRFPYSALRERLAGVSAADWMREARLCVFMPVYAGTSHYSFHDDQYHWRDYGSNARGQKENLDDAKIIEAATLPANHTAQQLDAYLDTILLNIPDGPGKALRHTVETKLSAIGASGLPALFRRLPLRQDVELGFVFPVISRLITQEQLPDLRAALAHDNGLVGIYLEKNWQADARDVLVAKLVDHRQPMEPEALRIAAEAKDPATYADLRWHFVHLDHGHEEVMDVLEKCPGFDLAGAVREAWEYARLGATDSGELSAVAARWDLPDALNAAVVHAGKERNSSAQQSDLADLATLTSYNGSTNAELPWLTANLGHFRYDAVQQRYSLEP